MILVGKSPAGQDVTWWLAPDYGNRVIKCETRWADKNSDVNKQYVVVDEYSKFVEPTNGIWLPTVKNVTKTVVRLDGTASETLRITGTTAFQSVNAEIDPAQFIVTPDPAAQTFYTDEEVTLGE